LTDQTQLEAERLRLHEAERRQRILSEISAILLDYVGGDEAEPLRRIVDKVVQGMGDWCAFSLIGPDGLLRQSAAYHPDPRQRDLAEKLNRIQHPRRWDAGPAQTNALVQKRPLVFEEITDEMLRAGVQGEDEYRLLKDIGLASAIVAPLVTGAEPLGTLILASAGAGGRKYTPNDVDFVVALADRASLAVRNARLVRELAEERDREQFAREGAERRAAELAASGVDAINLHHSDWSGGLTTLFHRFERLTFGWDAQHERVLRGLLRMGIDGVYSDWVDRMVDALRTRDQP